jgi:type VI secretion system protein ImpK
MLGRSINPLVDASSALLVLATQVRNTTSHADVEGLRSFAVQLMKKFEATANDSGYAQETVLTARYILCVFVDESVLGTPWGGESLWGAESLLSTFHNETWGGEKFFVLLDRLVQQPASQRDLLELFYICLALGFRGKYGVAQMGLSQLSDIQGNLYRAIINQHSDFERELSPRWAGVPDKRNVLERYVPLWVVATLAGVLLLVVFSGFRVILHGTSNPVIDGLDSISQGVTTVTQTTQNQ